MQCPDALAYESGSGGKRTDVDDRERLLARLREAGCSEPELERAIEEGRIATFAVECALGGSPVHTLTAVAREAKLSPGFVRELMLATGRPSPKPRERLYTDDDVEVARLTHAFLDVGMPHEEVLEVARVLGLTMSQTTEAIREPCRAIRASNSSGPDGSTCRTLRRSTP